MLTTVCHLTRPAILPFLNFPICIELNHYLVWTRFGAHTYAHYHLENMATQAHFNFRLCCRYCLASPYWWHTFHCFSAIPNACTAWRKYLNAGRYRYLISRFTAPVVCTAAQTKSGIAVICAVSQYIDKRR